MSRVQYDQQCSLWPSIVLMPLPSYQWSHGTAAPMDIGYRTDDGQKVTYVQQPLQWWYCCHWCCCGCCWWMSSSTDEFSSFFSIPFLFFVFQFFFHFINTKNESIIYQCREHFSDWKSEWPQNENRIKLVIYLIERFSSSVSNCSHYNVLF